MGVVERPRWNHNIHFHGEVLDAIPAGSTSGLDVGTGDGLLAADMRSVLTDVTGVDIDGDVLGIAAAEHQGITWVRGDALTYDFNRTFDVVASVATLHHFPNMPDAFKRMAELTAPGGILVVIGLARATSVRDHLMGWAGVVQHQWYSRTRSYWEHSAPTVWPPPHSYREVRACAEEVLPGVIWKQFALWRYSLVWQKPE